MLHLSRALIKSRTNEPAFHSDRIEVLESDENVLAYLRGSDVATAVLCVFNLSPERSEYTPPEPWRSAETLHQGGQVTPATTHGGWSLSPWSWRIVTSPS